MNFQHTEFWPVVVVVFIMIATLITRLESKFFKMVKTYWFYKRSFVSWLSTVFLLSGILLLLVSLLDARGPEQRIKTPTPIQRSIILIDTSASMLAEDVKPSRLQKAVLIAKHFARKAAGHQLSVVAFAETQKKIVPFTKDLDLIDARLDSLKILRNQNGSSALSLAIQESIQYFKETGDAVGNILVLTDGEETSEGIDLNVPKEIHVALVAVGTNQGGKIPLDDARGFRFGYKKHQGSDVITKLDERFFKKVASDLPSGKYWLTNTYSLPSDEILEFFNGELKKGEAEQDLVIRPVMMEWLVVPAIILFMLSYLLKSIRIFTLLILLGLFPQISKSSDVELPAELTQQLGQLQKGELNQLERLKLAGDLNQAGAKDEALQLFEENLPFPQIDTKIPREAYLNYGTALLEKGEAEKGIAIYETLESTLNPKNPDERKLKDMIRNNITAFFKDQEQKEQEKNKQNKDQKEQQGQDQKDQQENQGSSGKSKDNKDQSGKNQKDPSKDPNGDEKDQKDKNKGKDSSEEDDKSKENDSKENPGEEKKDNQEKLPQQKIPAKLKQLMSDDRQLQMKMIESGTRDLNKRNKSKKSKDW